MPDRAKKTVYAVAVILVAGLMALQCFRLWHQPFFSDPDGSILLVTSAERPTSFAEQVAKGAYAARDELARMHGDRLLPPVERVELGVTTADVGNSKYTAWKTDWHIHRILMTGLARGHVGGRI